MSQRGNFLFQCCHQQQSTLNVTSLTRMLVPCYMRLRYWTRVTVVQTADSISENTILSLVTDINCQTYKRWIQVARRNKFCARESCFARVKCLFAVFRPNSVQLTTKSTSLARRECKVERHSVVDVVFAGTSWISRMPSQEMDADYCLIIREVRARIFAPHYSRWKGVVSRLNNRRSYTQTWVSGSNASRLKYFTFSVTVQMFDIKFKIKVKRKIKCVLSN